VRVALAVTALDLAEQFRLMGVRERPGTEDHPLILAMLQSVAKWPQHDEVPWCSACCHFTAELLGLPRPSLLKYDPAKRVAHGQGPLQARTWLRVGRPVTIDEAVPGFDVVVLARGGGSQPGAEVIDAPAHVGWFVSRRPGLDLGVVTLNGGNQSNEISLASYPIQGRLLGVRRLLG